MDLPLGEHAFYAGIDPGFSGGIGLISKNGQTVKSWKMPTSNPGKDRKREFSLDGLNRVFNQLTMLPDVTVGIEWPTTRPGEGAERSERFGRGKGLLQAFAYCKKLDFHLIAPNLWKGRLGIPGKTDPEANKIAAAMFERYYPDHADVIRGPRGGIKDGRLDALLIAHFLRTRGISGMRSVVEQFGKDSDEAMALLFKSARPGRRRKRKK